MPLFDCLKRKARRPKAVEPQSSLIAISSSVQDDSTEATKSFKIARKDLWQEAYETLLLDDRRAKLLTAYTDAILMRGNAQKHPDFASMNGEERAALVQRVLSQRLDSVKAIQAQSSTVAQHVQTLAVQIVQKVSDAKDAITFASSFEPHAALVWSGISLLLPLLLNAPSQSAAAMEGLEYISELLTRYKSKDENYRPIQSSKLNTAQKNSSVEDLVLLFEKHTVTIYANVLEYQMRMFCQYSSPALRRYLRNVAIRDDWNGILKDIQNSDRLLEMATKEIDSTRLNQGFSLILDEQEKAVVRDVWQSIMSALSSNYTDAKNASPKPVPGTCDWFTELDTFKKWMESDQNRFLFVTGAPGCGKSVIMRHLVDSLIQPSATLTSCYFFFRDAGSESFRQKATDALAAIVHQIFRQRRGLVDLAISHWELHGNKLSQDFSALWSLFTACIEGSNSKIICILDGLDECSPLQRHDFIDAISTFFRERVPRQGSGYLKLMVSGRGYFNEEFRFQSLIEATPYNCHLPIDDQDLTGEMETIIAAEVSKLKLTDAVKVYLKARLCQLQTHTRTFLWLKLVLDYLRFSKSLEGAGRGKIGDFIMTTPRTVDEAYEKILERSENPAAARRLLHIILGALEPLSIADMKAAFALAYGESYSLSDDLELQEDALFVEMAHSICGLFLCIADGRFYLFHQTARTFLVRSSESSYLLSRWQNTFSLEESRQLMLEISLYRLALTRPCHIVRDHFEFGNEAKLRKVVEEICESYPLFRYAACHWMRHYQENGPFYRAEPVVLAPDRLSSIFRTVSADHITDVGGHHFWEWILTRGVYSGLWKNRSERYKDLVETVAEFSRAPRDAGSILPKNALAIYLGLPARTQTVFLNLRQGYRDGGDSRYIKNVNYTCTTPFWLGCFIGSDFIRKVDMVRRARHAASKPGFQRIYKRKQAEQRATQFGLDWSGGSDSNIPHPKVYEMGSEAA